MVAGRAVPPDFVAFVSKHSARLGRACDEIVGNADVAEVLRTELLVAMAGRWRWWRARSRQPHALVHLEGQLRRASRREGTAAPAASLELRSTVGLRADDRENTDDTADVLAASAWRRAARLRHHRWVGLAMVAIVVGLAVAGPHHALPPVNVPVPTRLPDGVTVLPPLATLSAAPSGVLPRRLDLSPSTVDELTPLSESPIRAAVLLARADTGRLVLAAADGSLRRVDVPGFLAVGVQPTSLSPAGTWIALRRGSSLVLLDVPTGRTQEVPLEGGRTGGGLRAPGDDYLAFGFRWLDEDTLLVAGLGGSLLVDASTGTVSATDVSPGGVITVRGRRSPALTELVTAEPGSDLAVGDESVRSVIITSPNPGLTAGARTPAVRRPVTGPPWLDAWTDAGWASSRFYVRACDLSRLELPQDVGVLTSAVAAVRVTGHHAATLVSVDGVKLKPLGFDTSEPGVALVSALTTHGTVDLLAWSPDNGRLAVVMTINADTEVSVADLLRPEWTSTLDAGGQSG